MHSGFEDFVIESYVWPKSALPVPRDSEETVIILPFRVQDDREEIATGLKRLGAGSLLFLREIDGIEWRLFDDSSGLYLRSKTEVFDDGIRQITLMSQEHEVDEIEEDWLVFSRQVFGESVRPAGFVEVAFSVVYDEKTLKKRVKPVIRSPLSVFFPTVLETHLGFLIQGPYRTTSSRDNIPHRDLWNRHCIEETAKLLLDALRWLRDNSFLDADMLRCLPMDASKFEPNSMFRPIFENVKQALLSENLIPCFGGGHVSASQVKIARTEALRDLLNEAQLADLFASGDRLSWVSGEITIDRMPEVRQYLMQELGIAEVTPEMLLSKLDANFLQAQSDTWIEKLYEYLNELSSLLKRAVTLPLVRLSDGRHVTPMIGGQVQVFLPVEGETAFLTVHSAVCRSDRALAFLRKLGLTEPDPVDDVIRNILPRYQKGKLKSDQEVYDKDIRRIIAAFMTDSKFLKEKLITKLREALFVMVIDTADNKKYFSPPSIVYIATDRLKELFSGVPGVYLVDERYECLRGEDARELLEASGVVRYLRPQKDTSLSSDNKMKLRIKAGHPETSGITDEVKDWSLLGLSALLTSLAPLAKETRRKKAKLLWEELSHLEERRGKGVFTGEYTWSHYQKFSAPPFDSAFVRLLNKIEWVPDADGNLQRPEYVLFDSLGWKPNPFLQSKIHFKPPIIDALAKEAGIEPGVLDLLKKHGVTSVAELTVRLGITEGTVQEDEPSAPQTVDSAIDALLGGKPELTPPVADPEGSNPVLPGTGVSSGNGHKSNRTEGSHGNGGIGSSSNASGQRTTRGTSARKFISYVSVHHDDEGQDPDGLEHQARMALEEKAIGVILQSEPFWQRTPALNPGYDLFEKGENGEPSRWCEVKAMTGSLDHRSVGLSHTQFDFARQHGDQFWLYIVEHTDDDSVRIVRIQNPAEKAYYFTFDRGWRDVAEQDPEQLQKEKAV